jgi:protein-L-isoaspartate O-methyltransferase
MSDRVFHVGCGVGYYTAVMAEVVGPQGNIVAVEVDPAIAARAKENLAACPHLTMHSGDGAALDPGECDAMLIHAGVTPPHPPWLDRLTDGGRLVLPLAAATAGPRAGTAHPQKSFAAATASRLVPWPRRDRLLYQRSRRAARAASRESPILESPAKIEIRAPRSSRTGRHMRSAFKYDVS